ncbi:MAG: hypothetical protein RLZZ156_2887 [Deinococcota bacterium]|jgi:hypothetical protein
MESATPVFVQSVRPWLELIYFVASSLGAVAVFVGIMQIRMMKKQLEEMQKQTEKAQRSIEITSTRESFVLATEKCDYFAEKIVILQGEALSQLGEETTKTLVNIQVTVDVSEKKISIKAKEKIDLSSIRQTSNVIHLLNRLESFASFFNARIADETIAYRTLGRAYCSIVKMWIPITFPDFKNNGLWKNTYQLLIRWEERIQKEKGEEEIKRLSKQLDDFTAKTQELKYDRLFPLGVSEDFD